MLGGDRAQRDPEQRARSPADDCRNKRHCGCVRYGVDQATKAEGEGSDRGNSRARSRIGQMTGKRSHKY
ncbi:hypothetical protein GCM10017712_16750 [Curtobacterium citreum]